MNTLDNIQHDLSDARFSVETAIELLTTLDQEYAPLRQALDALVDKLNVIHGDLDEAHHYLDTVQQHASD